MRLRSSALLVLAISVAACRGEGTPSEPVVTIREPALPAARPDEPALPVPRPDDFALEVNEHNGYGTPEPGLEIVRVSSAGGELVSESGALSTHATFPISSAELDALYATYVAAHLDQIRLDGGGATEYGPHSIIARAAGVRHALVSDGSHTFRDADWPRFQAVASAAHALADHAPRVDLVLALDKQIRGPILVQTSNDFRKEQATGGATIRLHVLPGTHTFELFVGDPGDPARLRVMPTIVATGAETTVHVHLVGSALTFD